jgi:NADH dehydrogenase
MDAVVNCVGILRERWGESYEQIHHLAPAALARACAAGGQRLVHVSALGLSSTARSGFLRSKLRGESAIRDSGADWTLVRPSLLEGEGGYGALWLRRVALWPIHPVPGEQGRIAIMQVRDLGDALAHLAQHPAQPQSREVEVGGANGVTIREYLAGLRRQHGLPPALVLTIPPLLARLVAHVCDLLHLTPFSFGHLELLSRDNLPRPNRLEQLLAQRAPAPERELA